MCRIYEGPGNFNTPALVVERDALFIPAGWDSPAKIAILYENIRSAGGNKTQSSRRSLRVVLKTCNFRVTVNYDSQLNFEEYSYCQLPEILS